MSCSPSCMCPSTQNNTAQLQPPYPHGLTQGRMPFPTNRQLQHDTHRLFLTPFSVTVTYLRQHCVLLTFGALAPTWCPLTPTQQHMESVCLMSE